MYVSSAGGQVRSRISTAKGFTAGLYQATL
jgi:hypothetical protein